MPRISHSVFFRKRMLHRGLKTVVSCSQYKNMYEIYKNICCGNKKMLTATYKLYCNSVSVGIVIVDCKLCMAIIQITVQQSLMATQI